MSCCKSPSRLFWPRCPELQFQKKQPCLTPTLDLSREMRVRGTNRCFLYPMTSRTDPTVSPYPIWICKQFPIHTLALHLRFQSDPEKEISCTLIKSTSATANIAAASTEEKWYKRTPGHKKFTWFPSSAADSELPPLSLISISLACPLDPITPGFLTGSFSA